MQDTESAKATAETWTADRGIAAFTDRSKFEDGYTGCAAVWESGDGCQGRKVLMERNKEVFDAGLCAIWIGLASPRDHLKDDWTGAKSITLLASTWAGSRGGVAGSATTSSRTDSVRIQLPPTLKRLSLPGSTSSK
jgi:hypothetical protein